MTVWKVLEIYRLGSQQLDSVKLHLEKTTGYCRMKFSSLVNFITFQFCVKIFNVASFSWVVCRKLH